MADATPKHLKNTLAFICGALPSDELPKHAQNKV